MNRPNLHLCDFDGTLYQGNSLLQYLWFSVPAGRLFGVACRLGLRFVGRLLKRKWAHAEDKQWLLAILFKGRTQQEMLASGAAFARKEIPPAIRPALLHTLQTAQTAGDRVVIVSASLSLWLRPYAENLGFELICTELAFENGVFTGQFALPNCNREEKVHRITEAIPLSDYEKVIAYGNPGGDDAMFTLADEVFRF